MNCLSTKAQEKQDSLKIIENPIVFGDLLLGYANTGKSAGTLGLHISYQSKNDLFTFRFLRTISVAKIEWFYIFPVSTVSNTNIEYAALYGKRFVEDGLSYHFSGGVSYNINEDVNRDLKTKDTFVGIPIALGMSFFKAKKRRLRVFYGLIPVGKPTSFGRSIGFKIYGNIAKRSYVGLGLTFGLGWHKIYNNDE
jgi:hypothetical protein